MTQYNLPVLVTVVMLFPMLYFGIASLTFFLRKFDDPIVTWMLRGLCSTYFVVVSVCCALGAAVFVSYGQAPAAVGLGLVAACAIVTRRWFLRGMDAQLRARDGGDGGAIPRLRRLHVGSIAYNAVQLVAVVAMSPL